MLMKLSCMEFLIRTLMLAGTGLMISITEWQAESSLQFCTQCKVIQITDSHGLTYLSLENGTLSKLKEQVKKQF